jgi:hypothetical protein
MNRVPLTFDRRFRSRRIARSIGLLAAVVAVLAAGTAAAGAAPVVANASLEALDANGFPTCWTAGGWGTNTYSYTVTGAAHSGARAMQLTVTGISSGDRKMMTTENACAPTVVPGHQYDLSVWYTSTTPNTAMTVFRHDTALGWQYWTDLATLTTTTAYQHKTVRTPVVPPATDQIVWGVSIYGVGTLKTDDYAMVDTAAPPPPTTTTTSSSSSTRAPTTTRVSTTTATSAPTTTTLPPPGCTGAACTKGGWQVMPTTTAARGVHAVVLRTGKVLLVAGSGNDPAAFAAGTFSTALYDPVTSTFTDVPTPADLFCSGHTQLADGRILIMGGTKAYPTADGTVGYEGLKDSYVFDPATSRYTRINDMNAGHWYPSATSLGNGDVLTLGGLGEDSSGTVATERYSAAQGRWLGMGEVNQTWRFWGLYPSMVLMQDGRLFYTGSHVFGNGLPGTGASIYDYGTGSVTDIAGLQNKDQRDQSMSVLLPPAQDQKVLTLGGGNIETNPDANRLTDVVDLKAATPAYSPGPLLPSGTMTGGAPQTPAQGKMYLSAVLLPDGKVFETGGALHNRADPVYEASMYDPVTNAFTAGMATDPRPRGYHSSAMLLADGRVMTFGDNPGNGTFDTHVSIYSPPYLYQGARPVVSNLSTTQWAYGTTPTMTVSAPITRASLIRPAAVTHSSDPNQRFVDLPLSVNGTTIGLNLTSNPNIAPPGWYMLFALGTNGVPSVATWVHVG